MKIAFTIATISYLPRAFVLAAGFLRFNRDYHSQYASTPRSRSWQQLLTAGNLRDRLKFATVFFFNLLPASLRRFLRRFSLFILRNVT